MSIKKKVILLATCFAVMAASLIAGCSIGLMSVDEFLEENDAKNQRVTYYANGGSFADRTDVSPIYVKNIYYKADSFITDDFGKGESFVSRLGYVFDDWYFAQTDADGNPVFDDEENLIVKVDESRKVDFTQKIPENTYWHICAKWDRDKYVKYVVACDTALTLETEEKDADGETVKKKYRNGDELYTGTFSKGADGTSTVTGEKCNITPTNATFLQMYKDEACTQPYRNYESIPRPQTEAEFVTVYAKFIAGKYTVVRDKTGVFSMLNNAGKGGSYYFFSEDDAVKTDKVIDCTDNTVKSLNLNFGQFNIKIEGNGFTLKNLTFAQTRIASGAYSVFGAMTEEASVKNLTLQNVNVSASLRRPVDEGNKPDIYLVSHAVSAAAFENFKIDGATFTVTCPDAENAIKNLSFADGKYTCGNLIFGGTQSTDGQFLADNAGIAITNYTLTVTVNNNTEIEIKNNQEANI